MKRGLGMWIMSKLVLLIFLFSLVLVLTMFMSVYSDKIVADTARSYTLLWGEAANGALLYRSSSDSIYLPNLIEIRDASQQYTVMVKKVGDERIVIFLAWNNHETEAELSAEGFVAATAINMPGEIEEIVLFEGRTNSEFWQPLEEDTLILNPSENIGRDETMIFTRNNSFFCVGSVKDGVSVEHSVELLADCCQKNWGDTPGCW